MLETLINRAAVLIQSNETQETIENIATKSAYVTSGVTVVGGITLNDWALIVGIIGTIITVSFNIWFKMRYRQERRKSAKKQRYE